MGALKPISRIDKRMDDLFITIDKSNRICLNANLQKELGLLGNDELYLFYDESDRRLGISKTCDDASVVPFTFDLRGYCSQAKSFLTWCGISTENGSMRMLFEGMEDNVYVFRTPGRTKNSFKQAKNGDLERQSTGY